MPTIKQNKLLWDGRYDWSNKGNEWSQEWGGVINQWNETILPRINHFVPTECILEIACGYGRWTEFLKELCNNLVLVDLSKECIEACKERFSEHSNIKYYLNDGKSLDMVPDNSVDFIFSFDSLVHVNELVMEAYLSQFSRILKKDGSAFIHHSNLRYYMDFLQSKYTFKNIKDLLKFQNHCKNNTMISKIDYQNRDTSVSADRVSRIAEENNLRCSCQEIIEWGEKGNFIDCLSTITQKNYLLSENGEFGINELV
jgi:ubiquinone/menaquinone biosynthesis C-methylase UbiE